MKAKILKRLTNDGKELEVGTIVDVSEWRNARSLEGSRYITFVSEEEAKAAEPKVKKATVEN
jgi:protein-arginine kinase